MSNSRFPQCLCRPEQNGICWQECSCDASGNCNFQKECAEFTCNNKDFRQRGTSSECIQDLCKQVSSCSCALAHPLNARNPEQYRCVYWNLKCNMLFAPSWTLTMLWNQKTRNSQQERLEVFTCKIRKALLVHPSSPLWVASTLIITVQTREWIHHLLPLVVPSNMHFMCTLEAGWVGRHGHPCLFKGVPLPRGWLSLQLDLWMQ